MAMLLVLLLLVLLVHLGALVIILLPEMAEIFLNRQALTGGPDIFAL